MASGAAGILTAEATPEVARRTWPRWLALAVLAIAVAVTGVLWTAGGARVLLGAVGLYLAVRGVLLLRGARGDADSAPARTLGGVATGLGAGALVVALASAAASGWVLLAGVPLVLLMVALSLMTRGAGTGSAIARRGGQALLVWTVLVTGLLVLTGVAQGWDRAVQVATVVAGLAVAVLSVPLLIGAANLRAVAARPAPPQPAGCAGCACGAGGCGALG